VLVCSGVSRVVVALLSRGHQTVAAGPGLRGTVILPVAGAG